MSVDFGRYALEAGPKALTSPPRIDLVKVHTQHRLEPGTALRQDLGGDGYSLSTVPSPCATWNEAAYLAHRLSPGRREAIAWIVSRNPAALYDGGPLVSTPNAASTRGNRGQSAALKNGLKALASDGLIKVTWDSRKTRLMTFETKVIVRQVSDRLLQYGLALTYFLRPIGRQPEVSIPELARKLTPRMRAVAEQITVQLVGSSHTGGAVAAPRRGEASAHTALERLGLVRWCGVEHGLHWFDVPATSNLYAVAAYTSKKAANALLLGTGEA